MKQHAPTKWAGEWFHSIRVEKNITTKGIADRLDIHPTNVARRECGDQKIDLDDLPSMLVAYGVTSQQFLAKLKDVMS